RRDSMVYMKFILLKFGKNLSSNFPWCMPDFNEVSSFCGNVMEMLCKLDMFQSRTP
ncbi:16292_t:CDS:1, partial [Rhizophagus irregularis]